jgi:hypothetical protein
MLGPGDEPGAGEKGQVRLRASRADRDRVVDALKSAFVQERLAKDEFDDRVGRALTARTCADLDALTADIPGGPPRPAGPPLPAGRVPAGPVLAGAGLVQGRADARASARSGSLDQNRSLSRSKTLVAGMAVVILMAGVGGGVLGGPGAGVTIAGLAAGVVFAVLWVIASFAMLRERPGPGQREA